jgi:hypothetical protein
LNQLSGPEFSGASGTDCPEGVQCSGQKQSPSPNPEFKYPNMSGGDAGRIYVSEIGNVGMFRIGGPEDPKMLVGGQYGVLPRVVGCGGVGGVYVPFGVEPDVKTSKILFPEIDLFILLSITPDDITPDRRKPDPPDSGSAAKPVESVYLSGLERPYANRFWVRGALIAPVSESAEMNCPIAGS